MSLELGDLQNSVITQHSRQQARARSEAASLAKNCQFLEETRIAAEAKLPKLHWSIQLAHVHVFERAFARERLDLLCRCSRPLNQSLQRFGVYLPDVVGSWHMVHT